MTFSVFRAGFALAQILYLAFTPYDALMQTVLGTGSTPDCDGLRGISALCVGGDAVPDGTRIIVISALLLLVVVGFLPRVMSVVHAWIAVSLSIGIALPDGGDSLAAIATIILVFVAFSDNRLWAWARRTEPLGPTARGVGFAGVVALRLQVAIVYLNSAFAKFGVEDWANGSAEYYVSRSYMFGASGLIGDALHSVTSNPLLLAAITWGVLLCEIAIGICILLGTTGRRVAFVLALLLHAGIILTIGLWSFGMIMISFVGIAAMPTSRRDKFFNAPSWVGPGRQRIGAM
ncbi:sporulation-delaying protein SdpB family protein [Leifsonia shinshuensis]|uniref:sporulation-delaying protein SdpB family protein n=1 Tax=Leifsonia shinshuensis TaxID=150026 RepID=UPI001629AEB7|nr:sporulation-delaying protein SdpB family protein [Leifsonia shinshuensis]